MTKQSPITNPQSARPARLTRTQRVVLECMNKGMRLVSSGVGGATLLDGHDMMHAVGYQTHQALIRRGLVGRIRGSNPRGSMVYDWYLTEGGLQALRDSRNTRKPRNPRNPRKPRNTRKPGPKG